MFLFVNNAGTAFTDSGTDDPTEMDPANSCYLDIIDRHENENGMRPVEIARSMGVVDWAIHLVLDSALRKAHRAAVQMKIAKPVPNE